MKLYEALELLEENDDKYITIAGISKEDFHIRKIGFSIRIYTSEYFKKKSNMFNTILFPSILSFENDAFIVHSEPKFKVGDLVRFKEKIFDRYDVIVKFTPNGKYVLRSWLPYFNEGDLTIIMPAQELAEKLGGSE